MEQTVAIRSDLCDQVHRSCSKIVLGRKPWTSACLDRRWLRSLNTPKLHRLTTARFRKCADANVLRSETERFFQNLTQQSGGDHDCVRRNCAQIASTSASKASPVNSKLAIERSAASR